MIFPQKRVQEFLLQFLIQDENRTTKNNGGIILIFLGKPKKILLLCSLKTKMICPSDFDKIKGDKNLSKLLKFFNTNNYQDFNITINYYGIEYSN